MEEEKVNGQEVTAEEAAVTEKAAAAEEVAETKEPVAEGGTEKETASVKEQAPAQEQAPKFVHVPVGTDETMEDYKQELEASFRQIKVGDILTGTVIAVKEDAVTVDLDYYAPGVIRAEDMSMDPHFSIMNDVKSGDSISATVVKKDDGAGNLVLSCVEASDTIGWERLYEYLNNKTVVPVKVSETVNKGVVAYLEGIRGFIPASQLALSYVEDFSGYVGQTLEVHVITVDKTMKKLVMSAKEVLKEQEAERVRRQVSQLVPGSVHEGKVESLQPYGAFVDLGGGMTGLVHVSQICERRIRKPSEVLKEGETVKVKVLKVDQGKISLSIKDAMEVTAPEAQEEEENVQQYSSGPAMSTSLGDLLKNFRL